MFLRTKKIKNNSYLYAIDNKWYKRKKGPRSKSQKYLGKCHKPERINNFKPQLDLKHIEITPFRKIIQYLVELELNNHGIEKQSRYYLYQSKFRLNPYLTPPINLEMNEGFLCNYTLNKLYNFKFKSSNLKEKAKELANTLLQAGLKVEEDLFIELYKKLNKELEHNSNNVQETNTETSNQVQDS